MAIDKMKQIACEKYGKNLTDEQAAYAEKHGKLSDDELDNVAGGGCSDGASLCPNCYTPLVQNSDGEKICPVCTKGATKIM